MPTRIPQPLGTLISITKFLMKRGWMPGPASVLRKPHLERLERVSPTIACKPGDKSIQTQDVRVQGRGGPIPARFYSRPGTQPGAPAYLFIHGGGFIDGGIDFCDNVQRGIAARTGWVVVALSYRLAPEHPFPAGLEDCEDVLRWMAETRPGGLDPERIAVGGESAGANLTVALCLSVRDNNGPRIAHQWVVYPFADTSLLSPGWESGLMPGIDRSMGEFMVRVYAGEEHAQNPLIDLVRADLRGLPPALVITCGHDVLREDGELLVKELQSAGVDTQHTHLDDMPHGYLMFNRLTKRSDESIDQLVGEVQKRFGRARASLA